MLDALSHFPRWLKVALVFPLIFLNAWILYLLGSYFEPLVSIVVTASLLAFLLDFPIRGLQDRKISRILAITLVLGSALLVFGLLVFILVPLIVEQLGELVNSLPKWLESGTQQLQNLEKWAIAQQLPFDIQDSLAEVTTKLTNLIQSLSSRLLNFILGTIGSLANVLFVLVLTVFLVLSGEEVWDGIFSWLPDPWDNYFRDSIQNTFENYFASQAILAGILSLAQTFVFGILNVPYAVLFGVTIGLTTLIPYASALTITIISALLILKDFWLGLKVLVAAIIVGQINDNVIAPRLVGGMIGLNPVWIILSLLVGGKLAGVLGLLIAIPLASVIKNAADVLRTKYTTKVEEVA
jgi:predicted PurR-regulated permease PerM